MPNNFTALVPTLFSAAQEVSKEPVAILDAISTSFDDKGVAKGDNVTVPIAPTRTPTDFTPAATSPEGDAATASNVLVTITASKKVSWFLTGEQLKSLQNADSDKEWARQLIMQGMRALRNLAESDAWAAVRVGASRAYGTAGTTPFASDLTALTNAYKMLKDNGAPMADLQLCVGTDAGLNLRNLGIIQQAYQAGSEQERRTGELLKQFGFSIRESAAVGVVTKGTGASYVTSGSTAAKVQDIALVTGTGTVLAGDVVTFAADTANKYVVKTGVAAAGTISLARPGARMTIPTGNALTVGNNFTANLAFERSAVAGVMRPPVMPENPTMKQQMISDERGMSYLLVEIAQYGQVSWELHLAWGFKTVQDEHVMLVLG